MVDERLGDEAPPRLLSLPAGALMYVHSDAQFKLSGIVAYTWAILYFVMICFEVRTAVTAEGGVDHPHPLSRPSDDLRQDHHERTEVQLHVGPRPLHERAVPGAHVSPRPRHGECVDIARPMTEKEETEACLPVR
jgi:hypothetical protein